ncbi:hypothetical protein LCGC14_2545450 [marine sediment metagenome]|uniref:Uncharacterized protein n=1 Tax=marine sediment metagenome TaxID=412755 RepID=A0A0F9BC84_9ZZZZ
MKLMQKQSDLTAIEDQLHKSLLDVYNKLYLLCYTDPLDFEARQRLDSLEFMLGYYELTFISR